MPQRVQREPQKQVLPELVPLLQELVPQLVQVELREQQELPLAQELLQGLAPPQELLPVLHPMGSPRVLAWFLPQG